MERYFGSKLLHARPMTRGAYNTYRGWEIPEDENPGDEGYLVVYTNDYESWSPRAVFEEAYRPMKKMTFGQALEAVKKGYKATRSGWNGAGQFIYLHAKDERTADPEGLCYESFIALKNAQDQYQPGWVASQGDMLAEDWEILL